MDGLHCIPVRKIGSHDALPTDVEEEVLRRVQDGKTNGQIAVELELRPKTVERHLHSIFQKLKVSSRTEAAVYATKNKLI